MYAKLLGITIMIAVIVAAVYMSWWLLYNDWATGHLARYEGHYRNVLSRHGLALVRIDGGYDDAPCEAKFLLHGGDVRVIGSSATILRLVNRVKHGKIGFDDLIAMSDTPYCKLPK